MTLTPRVACIGLLLSVFCTVAAAQGTYKCKDAAGKITYSGNECHLIGLSSAGEVSDRSNVAPAFKLPANLSVPAAPGAKPAAAAPKESAKAPAEPERRCFTVKTAKGVATRCNDTPPEEEAERK